jgi:hypothetical protein
MTHPLLPIRGCERRFPVKPRDLAAARLHPLAPIFGNIDKT